MMRLSPDKAPRKLFARTYTFDDKSQYKVYRIQCKYEYTTEQVIAILRKVKTYLAIYVYIPCVISDCLLIMLQRVLQRKGMYRFKTKKDFLEMQSDVRKIIKAFEDDFCNTNYFDELSMSYYDEIEGSMMKFQKFIEVKLANLGRKNVSISALSYLSFQMACEGVVNYGTIINGAITDFDFDFREMFLYLCPDAASEKMRKFMVSTGLSEDFVKKFNEKKEVKEMFSKIEQIFINQEIQKKAAKAALEEVDEDTKANMKFGSNEIEDTLKEIEINNLKKKGD